MPRDPRFSRRVVGQLIRWETPGEEVYGHLIDIETVKAAKDGNPFFLARLGKLDSDQSDSSFIKVTVPPMLADLLKEIEKGEAICITYVRQEEPAKGQREGLKVFEVHREA